MKHPKLKILLLTLLIGIFMVGSFAMAQDIGLRSGGNLEDVTKVTGHKKVTDVNTIDEIAQYIIAYALGLVGILFLAFTIYSGIQWMTAGGNEEQVTQSKTRIKNSTIGLTLVFFAFIISNTIFNFVYEQTDWGSATPQGPEYEDNGILGFKCENNRECPPNQPICESVGGGEVWGVNFNPIFKYCTCHGNNDCTDLPTPFCFDRPYSTNICSACLINYDGNLNNKEACQNEREACIDGVCIAQECLTSDDCNDEAKPYCRPRIHLYPYTCYSGPGA